MTIFCATGHRPDKLGGYSPQAAGKLIRIALDFLEEHPAEKIISGMALGWDLAWANAGILLGIPVVAAIPFKGQESRWPQSSQDSYNSILEVCTEIVEVSEPGYAIWKMHKRNEWMVDTSDEVIALFNGTKGGTSSCVFYAEKIGKPITNLWNRYNNDTTD